MQSLQYGLWAAGATICGGLLVVVARKFSMANKDTLLAFAAGVLIGLSFAKIFPEAYDHNPHAPLLILAGFFVMYLVEQFAIPHHGHQHDLHHDHDHPPSGTNVTKSLGWLAWAGVFFHSLVDGLAISSGAAFDPGMARSMTAGVVLHELPEGVLAASLLLAAGQPVWRIILLTAAVAFATPVGAVLTDTLLSAFGTESIVKASSMGMAVAGGTFVYVGVADMLHHAHAQEKHPLRAATAFTLGLGLFVVQSFI